MKIQLCILAALLAAGNAIISQPHCCDDPRICAPRVITYCPRKDPIPECSTCCCDSSENVEFYNPARPEPWCSAPPAIYTVRFVGTWTGTCQPDYYPSNAHWSPPTGASHNTQYQMWDACMDNPSPGVALVSQTGSTSVIQQEYVAAGESILDTFIGNVINGGGEVSSDLEINKYYQWVSAVSMLAPSLDRMVGVAGLRLCDGVDWKRSVKVCSELFSTATKSDRVHPPMQRNSVQWNNCSFGYFEFTFTGYQNVSQEPPTGQDVFLEGDVCPAAEYQPKDCRTCCCKSSDNVNFYHPGAAYQPECGARDDADYKVSLIPSISSTCQPDLYPFIGEADFSELFLVSHPSFQAFDKLLLRDSLQYHFNESALAALEALLDYEFHEGLIHAYRLPTEPYECPEKDMKRRTGVINLAPYASYLTVISTLMPAMDKWVGFSGLNLCGSRGWMRRVEVCLPLLEAVEEGFEGDPDIQGNNCSFGSLVIERLDRPVRNCRPHDESVYLNPNLSLSACCYSEFILEGQIIDVSERHGDPQYSYTLLARITTVYYDEIDHIEVGDIVTIKACGLPFRIKFKRTYRLTGSRELGTNELEISENGVIANIPELGEERALGEGPCPPYILGGNCDDPR